MEARRFPPASDPEVHALRVTRGLYTHQVEGVAFLMQRRRAILADDMGLGKTRQAIVSLIHTEPTGPYLVVCPAGQTQLGPGDWTCRRRSPRPHHRSG